jgi:hypothetical protein
MQVQVFTRFARQLLFGQVWTGSTAFVRVFRVLRLSAKALATVDG